MANTLLSIRGLAKSFGSRQVLDRLDLDVERGEVIVIMGPSGSGKTTLLRAINALEIPDSGVIALGGATVEFGGIAPTTAQLRALRLRTAMVFQSFNLFPHRSVLDNVIEGSVYVKKVPRAEASAKGMELLARMGLADRANDFPSRLSGGQKQRVAIARGLAMEPELMLFDEPTSALDPSLRMEVLGVMRELARSGMTMLVVTHEAQFAREAADRILFFNDGRIQLDGSPSEFREPFATDEMRTFFASLN